MVKSKKYTLAQQAQNLLSIYPSSKIFWSGHNKISWTMVMRPTVLSREYKVNLTYKQDESPKVFIIEPKNLPVYKGSTKLIHVYDAKRQRLCLYYPKANEWNEKMLISDTIVPWISDWLFHYEIWSFTGVWNGGGIHVDKAMLKEAVESIVREKIDNS
ncbi:MAG: hypothetical protein MJ007_03315 [Paludibacteraceae bacterium]|nr:hypothetical protein [Paludibacteraceae bacterium]